MALSDEFLSQFVSAGVMSLHFAFYRDMRIWHRGIGNSASMTARRHSGLRLDLGENRHLSSVNDSAMPLLVTCDTATGMVATLLKGAGYPRMVVAAERT